MSSLRIKTETLDLRLDIAEGDGALAEILTRINRDIEGRGGFWFAGNGLRDIAAADSQNTDQLADLIWCPAATTVVTATFGGEMPTAAAQLSIFRFGE